MENEEIQSDIKKYSAFASLGSTEGGALLIDVFIEDILTTVTKLSHNYKTLTHMEMVALCASLESKLDVVRTLSRSVKNRDGALDALAEALKE